MNTEKEEKGNGPRHRDTTDHRDEYTPSLSENISEMKRRNREEIFGLLSGSYWTAVVVVYVIVSFGFSRLFGGGIWAVSWLIFVAASAGQCLMTAMSNYKKAEEAKERMYSAGSDDEANHYFKIWRKRIDESRGAVYGGMWIAITVLYFVVSFALRIWAFSWILFVAGAVVQNLLIAYHKMIDNKI